MLRKKDTTIMAEPKKKFENDRLSIKRFPSALYKNVSANPKMCLLAGFGVVVIFVVLITTYYELQSKSVLGKGE